jgi:hypothetical protein
MPEKSSPDASKIIPRCQQNHPPMPEKSSSMMQHHD